MKIHLKTIACLGMEVCALAAYSQSAFLEAHPEVKAHTAASPAAYVYVASTPKNGSINEIVGYVAADNGSLSAVTGSPFQENVASMAVNGKYLMAATVPGASVDAFLIEPDGALRYANSTEYAKYNDGSADCGYAGQIFFDHTGSTLYIQEFDGSSACANDVYASFAVMKSSGALNYLGTANVGAFPGVDAAAYFLGNNVFAYSALNSYCEYYAIYGLKRASNGNLSLLSNVEKNSPKPPVGVNIFLPDLAVADPSNHVAVAMQPANPPGCANGPIQMATYTADSSGNLTTASTVANMPVSANSAINDMKMSPSGKLLAVAGQQGLQIFHFNGASPITHDTGLLTADAITQMFWDNSNHLYAISQASGKLFVYTVTPTGVSAAPGSPYAIANPQDLIVQPYPPYETYKD